MTMASALLVDDGGGLRVAPLGSDAWLKSRGVVQSVGLPGALRNSMCIGSRIGAGGFGGVGGRGNVHSVLWIMHHVQVQGGRLSCGDGRPEPAGEGRWENAMERTLYVWFECRLDVRFAMIVVGRRRRKSGERRRDNMGGT
jgi:hypothetical protein